MSAAAEVSSAGHVQLHAKTKAEMVLLSCSVVSLLVSCILWSARKQAWMDEILTWNEVSDRSLRHLFSAIQHGADGGQPLFYLTAWLWARAFGVSVLSLRLYSSLGVCGAFLITWACLRQVFGLWTSAFGVLAVWGASSLLLDQNAEARFYGLFLLSVAVAVWLYQQLARTATPGATLLILNLLAQSALVLTHVLGVLYGVLILTALIFFDRTQRRFRIQVYLSHAAGWLALLLWVPAIRASMAAGKPHGWIPQPTLYNVYDAYTYWAFLPWLSWLQRHAPGFVFQLFRRGAILAFFLPLAVVLLLTAKDCFSKKQRPATQREAMLLIAFALLSVPLVLFALSRLVTPVLAPRYVLPSAIGMAIVLAAFADWLRSLLALPLHTAARVAAILVVLMLMASPVASALLRGPASENWRFLDVQRLDKVAPPGLAVVAGWQQDFSRLMRYSQRSDRPYYFLLDWQAALTGPGSYVLDYHLMHAYREAGYYAPNIEYSKSFLCAHLAFLVLDAHDLDPREQGSSWFDSSLKNDPHFRWQVLRSFDGPEVRRDLIAVHQVARLEHCDQR